MSELKTNKISPATLNDVVLGDDGDTFTIPSGATIVNSGTATGFGKVVQVVNATVTDRITGTTTTNGDDTIPQITEGVEIITCAITPTSTSNKLFITTQGPLFCSSGVQGVVSALFNTDHHPTNALAAKVEAHISAGYYSDWVLHWYGSPAVTDASTYRVRVGMASNTVVVNGGASRNMGGVSATTLTIMEISA